MPLSEQEQRLLDEMERSLYHGDADFVASVGRARGRNYTAVVGGVLLAAAGVGLLVLGVLAHSWIIGTLGFLAMFTGVMLAAGQAGRRPGVGSFPSAAGTRRTGFMDRMAERWERRRQS